ncbi:autophagy-related 3 protein [Rutstroemia sp. NJR-2017a WRK4]|nr:autophagy-related 3 protein [Rutstroemia sp. NJR-2017a WRK4]
MTDAVSPAPFMRIPCEIRLMIYQNLFDTKGHKVFEIRNVQPEAYAAQSSQHNRSSYSLMRQRTKTTYKLCTDVEIHTSIMSVNRKVYEETSHLLYGNRTFSFYKDIEAIIPFFSDLSPRTRPLVQEISLYKQGFVFCRESNRCEWSNICEFLADKMQLRSLKLIVEGGRPRLGWDDSAQYTLADFITLSRVAYEPLEWALQLLEIKGIQKLDISSEIHSIPPPSHSAAMAFFGAFSTSIETGFAEFLRREMIAA